MGNDDNLAVDCSDDYISLIANKPGVSAVTVVITNNLTNETKEMPVKYVVIKPTDIVINECQFENFGIENIWTIGKYEVNNSPNVSKVTSTIGPEDVGSGFWSNFGYYIKDNDNVTITNDGVINILNDDFVGLVDIVAKFEYEGVCEESEPFTIRCVGNGYNVRSFSDLHTVTTNNQVVVLQEDIDQYFGYIDGKMYYNESTVNKIQSTYDITHYENIGRKNDAKIKTLIDFKADVYGNGKVINAHNVAYGLDAAGMLKSDALFKGPLNFVSMTEGESGLVSVKGQDNVCFAVYEGVSLNNIVLQSCTLQPDANGVCDLTDLTYVGTTVEVFGDNVDINYCRILNGRTVLRIFGDGDSDGVVGSDIADSNKVINVNINNSVLSKAREFVIRMGSNCFVTGTKSDPAPYIDNNDKITIPAQKVYGARDTTTSYKNAYDAKYIKTFVNLKNSILQDAGLFCIGIDTHFAGGALADGEGLLSGLIDSWKNLAKTSYGAKLTIEGDVRIYDWKKVSDIDSSTLIEVQGTTDYAELLNFDVKELINSLANNTVNTELNKIVCTYVDPKTNETHQYVHGGIAFFGGGKNYSVVDFKDYEFYQLNGYEVKLSDVNKVELQAAAGNESFYFLLNDYNTKNFQPADQIAMLKPSSNTRPEDGPYSPIYRKD